jgi:hypothetical protein
MRIAAQIFGAAGAQPGEDRVADVGIGGVVIDQESDFSQKVTVLALAKLSTAYSLSWRWVVTGSVERKCARAANRASRKVQTRLNQHIGQLRTTANARSRTLSRLLSAMS